MPCLTSTLYIISSGETVRTSMEQESLTMSYRKDKNHNNYQFNDTLTTISLKNLSWQGVPFKWTSPFAPLLSVWLVSFGKSRLAPFLWKRTGAPLATPHILSSSVAHLNLLILSQGSTGSVQGLQFLLKLINNFSHGKILLRPEQSFFPSNKYINSFKEVRKKRKHQGLGPLLVSLDPLGSNWAC